MGKFGSKQILPLIAFAIGAIYVGFGVGKYGFWDEVNGPRSGFFPVIAGCVMMLGALIAFFQSFGESRASYLREDFYIVYAVVLAIIASYCIGLVPASLAMVFIWLKFYEKESLKNSIYVTLVISAIVIGVFVYWLDVPFPKGALGDMLLL